MKTLKISEQTHKRLTTYKAILGCKTLDKLINLIIDASREADYEYGEITLNQYEALANYDK